MKHQLQICLKNPTSVHFPDLGEEASLPWSQISTLKQESQGFHKFWAARRTAEKMGNLISCGLGHAPSQNVVKVVHCNGLVDEFHWPVRVGELTIDYPDHFICHSNDLSISRNVPPLPDDEEMELGQIYFLLPRKTFESPLTQADVAALISKAAVARKSSYKGSTQLKHLPPLPRKPAFEMKQNGATTQVTVSREFLERLLADHQARLKLQSNSQVVPSVSDTDRELVEAYTEHLLAKSCRAWRPKLETIEEGNLMVG